MHHEWHQAGIGFRFENDAVTAIFLYAQGADDYQEYRGEMPEGLSFSDTRGDVEDKLGRPDKTGGNGVIPFWADFPRNGLSITYVSIDERDSHNRIHHITITRIAPPNKADVDQGQYAQAMQVDKKRRQAETAEPWSGTVASPPKPTNWRRIGCWSAAGVLLLAIVCCGVPWFCGYFFIMPEANKKKEAVKAAADEFLQLLAKDKLHDAYRSTTREFRAGTDEIAFTALVTDLDLANFAERHWKELDYANPGYRLDGFITTKADRVVPVVIHMIEEDGVYKVRSLSRGKAK